MNNFTTEVSRIHLRNMYNSTEYFFVCLFVLGNYLCNCKNVAWYIIKKTKQNKKQTVLLSVYFDVRLLGVNNLRSIWLLLSFNLQFWSDYYGHETHRFAMIGLICIDRKYENSIKEFRTFRTRNDIGEFIILVNIQKKKEKKKK